MWRNYQIRFESNRKQVFQWLYLPIFGVMVLLLIFIFWPSSRLHLEASIPERGTLFYLFYATFYDNKRDQIKYKNAGTWDKVYYYIITNMWRSVEKIKNNIIIFFETKPTKYLVFNWPKINNFYAENTWRVTFTIYN